MEFLEDVGFLAQLTLDSVSEAGSTVFTRTVTGFQGVIGQLMSAQRNDALERSPKGLPRA